MLIKLEKQKLYLYIYVTAVLCSLLSFCMSKNVYASNRLQEPKNPVILVIDPGHGGENEGTTEGNYLEKEMTMVTAEAIQEELQKYEGIKVYLTHTQDIDMSLPDRASFAEEQKADFLLSIHYNASEEHELFGTEVWISSKAPFNAYGYQFGNLQQQEMQSMGLFSRGVKTRKNKRGTDYYGIIRECSEKGIPSAILEHCHVDESRDLSFCETKENWIEFGKKDATAIAKYFGLKSEQLGVDYSKTMSEFPDAIENQVVERTLEDFSPPDVCVLECVEERPEEGKATYRFSAADYDTPLIYYTYSYDGGVTYSKRFEWPESNAVTNTYQDTFEITIDIPEDTFPNVIFRAYNYFDIFAESNVIVSQQVYRKKQTESMSSDITTVIDETEIQTATSSETEETEEVIPVFYETTNELPTEDKTFKLLVFLLITLAVILTVFLIALILSLKKTRKKH